MISEALYLVSLLDTRFLMNSEHLHEKDCVIVCQEFLLLFKMMKMNIQPWLSLHFSHVLYPLFQNHIL